MTNKNKLPEPSVSETEEFPRGDFPALAVERRSLKEEWGEAWFPPPDLVFGLLMDESHSSFRQVPKFECLPMVTVQAPLIDKSEMLPRGMSWKPFSRSLGFREEELEAAKKEKAKWK